MDYAGFFEKDWFFDTDIDTITSVASLQASPDGITWYSPASFVQSDTDEIDCTYAVAIPMAGAKWRVNGTAAITFVGGGSCGPQNGSIT